LAKRPPNARIAVQQMESKKPVPNAFQWGDLLRLAGSLLADRSTIRHAEMGAEYLISG